MQRFNRNENAAPMLTDQERLIQFIIQAVQEKKYNLARLLISYDQNIIEAFYKIQDEFIRSRRAEKCIPPGFLASLYHRELRRVLTENAVKRQVYLCLCDLSQEFVTAIGKYAEEQFVAPTIEFKKNIEAMYQQFINGRKQKLINTLLSLYKARIDDNSEAEVWFDNRCYSIRRERNSYFLRLQNIAHYDGELLDLATNDEEFELITQLIKDCRQRDLVIQRQFTQDKIDSKNEDFQELNKILIRMHITHLKLRRVVDVGKGPVYHYLTQDNGDGLSDHNDAISRLFDDIVMKYFPAYNFNLSYDDNVKHFKELANSANQLHDELHEYNTLVGMHHESFLSNMLHIDNSEKTKLKRFLNCEVLSLETVSNLGPRVLHVNDIVDQKRNNLLHILLQNDNVNEPFLLFLLKQEIDVFSMNEERMRPIDLIAANCVSLPINIYKILLRYAIECTTRLVSSNRDVHARAAKIVIEILFSEIVSYVEKKHLDAVLKLDNNIPGRINKTVNRAIKIAECLSFFHDHLSGPDNGATVNIHKLKEFVEKVKDSIETVLIDRRSALFKIMSDALAMLQDPRNEIIDRQAEMLEGLSRKVDTLERTLEQELTAIRRQHQEQHEEILRENRTNAERTERLIVQNQAFLEKMLRQQQEFMQGMFQGDGRNPGNRQGHSPRFNFSGGGSYKNQSDENQGQYGDQRAKFDTKTEGEKEGEKKSVPSLVQGLDLLRIQGDGHCFFRAVSLYLGEDISTLRRQVAEHIRRNMDEFNGIIRGINPNVSIRQYLVNLENGNEWADDLEIAILMRILNRPIVIVGPNGMIRNLSNLIGEDSPIFVHYNGHNHYNALILNGSIEADQILRNLIESAENLDRGRRVHTESNI